jgi:ABC-2 type transport system ATP-binding protein
VIILSTHVLEEVNAVCTRAIIIARGRILADGSPAELEARSRIHNAVRVAISGKVSETKAMLALGELADVHYVEVVDAREGLLELRVFPVGGRSIVASVSHQIRAAGWEVEELHVERGQLDEVFRDITTQAGEDPG